MTISAVHGGDITPKLLLRGHAGEGSPLWSLKEPPFPQYTFAGRENYSRGKTDNRGFDLVPRWWQSPNPFVDALFFASSFSPDPPSSSDR